ncbi:hypothetical protein BJX64DRAFT_43619 [Aspergillus heterothallicus]
MQAMVTSPRCLTQTAGHIPSFSRPMATAGSQQNVRGQQHAIPLWAYCAGNEVGLQAKGQSSRDYASQHRPHCVHVSTCCLGWCRWSGRSIAPGIPCLFVRPLVKIATIHGYRASKTALSWVVHVFGLSASQLTTSGKRSPQELPSIPDLMPTFAAALLHLLHPVAFV